MEENSNIQLILTCSICHEIYNEPKQLSCGHSFCRTCLEQIRQLYSVTCAICRKPTYLNNTGLPGIRDLPTNYPLVQIIEAVKTTKGVPSNLPPVGQQQCFDNEHCGEQPPIDHSMVDGKQKISDFVCGDCRSPVLSANVWLCGDCEEFVYCAPCIITKHKFHRKCVQMNAFSKEWQTACHQYDALAKKIESSVHIYDNIVQEFGSTKALNQNVDEGVSELKQTCEEIAKMFVEAQRLRASQNDFKHVHIFKNMIKELDFYATQLNLLLPVLNEHITKTNECLSAIENDSKSMKWSTLRHDCQINVHGSTPVLFFWSEPLAKSVSLAGTFTSWKPTIQMIQRNGEFIATVALPPGRHEFKFWVDNQWQTGSDWQTCKDGEDNVNNFIVL